MKRPAKTPKNKAPSGVLTYDVPEAGAKLGLGLTGSYEAAKAGLIPTIRVGAKRLKVPKAAFHQKFGGEAA